VAAEGIWIIGWMWDAVWSPHHQLAVSNPALPCQTPKPNLAFLQHGIGLPVATILAGFPQQLPPNATGQGREEAATE